MENTGNRGGAVNKNIKPTNTSAHKERPKTKKYESIDKTHRIKTNERNSITAQTLLTLNSFL